MTTKIVTETLDGVQVRTYIEDDLSTTVHVSGRSVITGKYIWVVGRAKCNPTDYYDENVGITIALGRALQKLGTKLEKLGERNAQTYSQHFKELNQKSKDARDLKRLRAEKGKAKVALRETKKTLSVMAEAPGVEMLNAGKRREREAVKNS